MTLGSADIPTHLATGFDRQQAERHLETAVSVRHLLESPDGDGGEPSEADRRKAAAARRGRGRSIELRRRTRASVAARERLS